MYTRLIYSYVLGQCLERPVLEAVQPLRRVQDEVHLGTGTHTSTCTVYDILLYFPIFFYTLCTMFYAIPHYAHT